MGVRTGSHPPGDPRAGLPLRAGVDEASGASNRPFRRASVAVVTLLLAIVALPTVAQAQPTGDGPYGSTTTTADQGPEPSCRLRESTVAAGDTATARVHAAPRGSRVEIRFDGDVVAAETAAGPGASPHVNVDIDFVVPADAEPGDHEVAAVGADFSASCGTLNTQTGEVLSSGQGNGGGSGALPRTGIYVALLLVIAVALLIVGRAVLEASRHRARTARSLHPRVPTRR